MTDHRDVRPARGAAQRVVCPQRTRGPALIISAGLMLTGLAPAGTDRRPVISEVEQNWRTSARDGANCLYFLVRFHGLPVAYPDVIAALGDGQRVSLADLTESARRLGLTAEVYHCGSTALADLREPVIAYTEPGGLESGRFMLILSPSPSDPQRIIAMDGGTAQVRAIDVDQFRRAWSGFILKRAPPRGPAWPWFAVGLAAAVLSTSAEEWLRRFCQRSDSSGKSWSETHDDEHDD